MMRAILISTHDSGGAGIFALRFHKFLIQNKHDSKLLVLYKGSKEENVIQYKLSSAERIRYKIRSIFNQNIKKSTKSKYRVFDLNMRKGFLNTQNFLKHTFPNPDCIIIFWRSRFINYSEIYNLKKRTNAKIVFFPLDMELLTGGCHYPWDCKGFLLKKCEGCPASITKKTERIISKNYNYKEYYLELIKPIVIACTAELKNYIDKSTLFSKSETISSVIGIDPLVYKPRNNEKLRDRYKIPNDKIVLLFGASDLEDERKGFNLLLKALISVKKSQPETLKKFVLLIVGKSDKNEFNSMPMDFRKLEFIKNDKDWAEIYNLADFYLSISQEDVGPMMINESLMSGTPVISFNIGVAQDLIQEDRNGFLIGPPSVTGLIELLMKLSSYDKKYIQKMKNNARNFAIKHLNQDINFKQILNFVNQS